jgi:hypothetical protein
MKKKQDEGASEMVKRNRVVSSKHKDSVFDEIRLELNLSKAFAYHAGMIIQIGVINAPDTPRSRQIVIKWDEMSDRITCTGGISDDAWEIFKVAYSANGRILLMSDKEGLDWTLDFRILWALR